MKQCPACQYQLEPFESTCPRCQRNAGQRNSTPAVAVSTPSGAIASHSAKAATPTTTAPSAEFSWAPGALTAGATFFVPAAIFAVASAMTADATRRARADDAWVVIAIALAPWLGGIGGYIGSAYGKFWPGVSTGLVFSVFWCLLCRTMGDAMASNVDFTLYILIFSLALYESAAIFGGVKRGRNGLVPVDGFTALTLFIGLLCLAFPIPGIVATTLLTRSDSDYSRPALYGTIAGLCIWVFIFLGAAVSSTMR